MITSVSQLDMVAIYHLSGYTDYQKQNFKYKSEEGYWELS